MSNVCGETLFVSRKNHTTFLTIQIGLDLLNSC